MGHSMAPDSAAAVTEHERASLRDRAVAGDTYARKLLVSDAMGLVHKAALRYQPIPDTEYAELVQVGVLALQLCVERWKPDRVAFSTFAFGRVRDAMWRFNGKRKRTREQAGDFDEVPDGCDTIERYETHELLARMQSAIATVLTDRQREIVTMRLREMPLPAICELYAITPERARQIEAGAMAVLREALAG